MRTYLLDHIGRYPKMQIPDAVKLLYQSEFGSGHMIADPGKSLERIRKEWNEVREMKNAGADCAKKTSCVIEEIGDGMCRISLDGLGEGLRPETLNSIFVGTAGRKKGTIAGFEEKLKEFRTLCEGGELPFKTEAVDAYVARYREEGYPAVSHSEEYRKSYHPAYRVADLYYARYYPVFLEIDRVLAKAAENPVTVSIDGMCGSGKTTLGTVLAEVYGCNLFHMDDFFLRPEQRVPERLAEPGGNVDYERFQEEVLDHLKDPEGLSYRVYDCSVRRLTETVTVPYSRLNIIEGAYSQNPYFHDPYDLRFFCSISEEEQKARILRRNGPEMLKKFQEIWIPMENRYFETFRLRDKNIVLEL